MKTASQTQPVPGTGAAPGMGKTRCRLWLWFLLCLATLAVQAGRAGAQATVTVSGGIYTSAGAQVPLQFTWSSEFNEGLSVSGQGWPPSNQTIGFLPVQIHIVGPQNLPGVMPVDVSLGTVATDSNGNISSNGFGLLIPFIANPSTGDVLRPGNYQVYAVKPSIFPLIPPIFAYSANNINICPMTLPPYAYLITGTLGNWMGLNWPRERGGRKGQLHNSLISNSPEEADPTWLSAWSEQPVAMYATVSPTDGRGLNQPAFISHAEYPGNHYAHDLNLELVPDPQYGWMLGVGNFNGDPTAAATGRLEWEWETQNGGSPFTYGQGNIGVPLWVTPTAGDRVYTVGRWVMDNGEGDKTEMHPARVLATMRKRNTAVSIAPAGLSILTRASQVDVFVSGHGAAPTSSRTL